MLKNQADIRASSYRRRLADLLGKTRAKSNKWSMCGVAFSLLLKIHRYILFFYLLLDLQKIRFCAIIKSERL